MQYDRFYYFSLKYSHYILDTKLHISQMTSTFNSDPSNDDDFNVIIQVGKGHDTKEFRAHSAILEARSSYFKIAFSSNWIVKKDNMIMFNKPNITPIVFDMVL